MDIKEIFKTINSFRRSSREYISNVFLTPIQLEELLSNPNVEMIMSEDALLILVSKSKYVQCYFFSKNDIALIKLINDLNMKQYPLVIDLIGKEKDLNKIVERFCENNLRLYSTYFRMACTNIKKFDGIYNEVELAKVTDRLEIYHLLYNEFDKIDAHLPELHEIESALLNEEITVIKEKNNIIGLAYFEKLGAKALYLREFLVTKEFRGKGLADKLLLNTINHSSAEKILLWVKSDNIAAIKKYEKYGFEADGLINHIMIYEGKGVFNG